MNYQNHYAALVGRAFNRAIDGYTESHHVKPRCMDGPDDASNLVKLTAREHYLAHLLLVKIYPGNRSLVFAAHMMTIDRHGMRVGNRKYEWLRKRHSEATSLAKRGNTHGLGKKRTMETRARMSAASMGGKGRTGIPWSQEQRMQLSAASMGRRKAATHCDAISDGKLERAKTLPAYSDGSGRVPGVTQRKNGAFVARARVNGERVYLGFFWSLDAAVGAIKAAL